MDGLSGFGSGLARGFGRGLSGFSGMRKDPLPEMASGTKKRLQQTVAENVRDMVRDTGLTEREAKQILKLQQRFPVMTVIEAIAYIWLERYDYEFVYQAPVAGGRGRLGGSVVDFLVLLGNEWAAWGINGYYFHKAIGQVERDLTARITVLASDYEGLAIRYYSEIWEYVILDKARRNHAFRMGLLGIEVGEV